MVEIVRLSRISPVPIKGETNFSNLLIIDGSVNGTFLVAPISSSPSRWSIESNTTEWFNNATQAWVNPGEKFVFETVDAEWLRVRYVLNGTSQTMDLKHTPAGSLEPQIYSLRTFSVPFGVAQELQETQGSDPKFNLTAIPLFAATEVQRIPHGSILIKDVETVSEFESTEDETPSTAPQSTEDIKPASAPERTVEKQTSMFNPGYWTYSFLSFAFRTVYFLYAAKDSLKRMRKTPKDTLERQFGDRMFDANDTLFKLGQQFDPFEMFGNSGEAAVIAVNTGRRLAAFIQLAIAQSFVELVQTAPMFATENLGITYLMLLNMIFLTSTTTLRRAGDRIADVVTGLLPS